MQVYSDTTETSVLVTIVVKSGHLLPILNNCASMYLIVRPCILNVFYVYLLLFTYS